MTDFAKPDSLPFRSHYFQQRRKKRKAANVLVQRYITSLSAAGGMYYELSEPVVIGAGEDFEVELFAASTETSSSMKLFDGDSEIDRLDINLSGSGFFDQRAYCTIFIDDAQTLAFPRNGVAHKVVLKRDQFNPDQSSKRIGIIGSRVGGSSFWNGEIYDVKIWTGGDRDTGTLVVDMPIDEDWKTSTDLHDAQGNVVGSAINVTENEAERFTKVDGGANWLGDKNLFNQPVVKTSWVDNGDGSYTKNTNAWGALGVEAASNLIGKGLYRVVYSMPVEVGQMRIWTRNTDDSDNVSTELQPGIGVTTDINVTRSGLWFDSNNSMGTTVSKVVYQRLIPIAGGD